ncbi:MAG TPA: choice-of-anchor R domain-containing protein [Acetobacteraceae bacterium]|nr:choice-of-anchor R domain-containing protein [Acetobacteraceae bacterium]
MIRMTKIAFALGMACTIAGTGVGLAAPVNGVMLSPNKRIVVATGARHARAYRPTVGDGRIVLFDNLAKKDPKGVYMDGTGFSFGGPNSLIGYAALAAAFTPTQTATVTKVEVAAGYITGAKSAVEVTIYADASGAPGATLWQGHAAMPVFGDCCDTVKLGVKTSLQLQAGTQYWVGLSAVPKGTDTFGAWDFNVADQVDAAQTAVDIGSGWMVSPSLPNVAFAVYGN